MTEAETERLIDRLVEDGKRYNFEAFENNSYRRKVEAEKLELQNEKGYRKNSTPVNEDQLNQTFERLVSDAKKRLLVQEEQERVKILKQQEMDKRLEIERSKSNYSG